MSNRQFFKIISTATENKLKQVEIQNLLRCSDEIARSYLPFHLAEKLAALPLGVIEFHNRKILTLGVGTDITNEIERELRFVCGIDIKLIPFAREILQQAIFLAYKGGDDALAMTADKLQARPHTDNKSKSIFGLPGATGEVNDFLETLISYAITRKASDIHLEPQADGLYVKLRVDGDLRTHAKPICSLDIYKTITNRLKILSNLDITKSSSIQEGAIKFNLDKRSISLRVSIMPTIRGEKVVIRLHGVKDLYKLEDLGLNPQVHDSILSVLDEMQGIIICAGTTGSGKSTTLYAILEKLSKYNKSIVTVEDPVEISLGFAAQTSIDQTKGYGYAESLKATLRQDPDCIMIGEIREPESAQIAFDAALTGHLVLCSIHAGTVKDTIQRVLDFGVNKVTFSQTCKLIICHELAQKICEGCGGTGLEPCELCDRTGYSGRKLITESLHFTSPLGLQENFDSWLVKSMLSPENYIDFQAI